MDEAVKEGQGNESQPKTKDNMGIDARHAATWWSISAMGMACGLTHPYEWLINYVRSYLHIIPYHKIREVERQANEAALAFFTASSSCPEETKEWEEGGIDYMYMVIDAFYAEGSKRAVAKRAEKKKAETDIR